MTPLPAPGHGEDPAGSGPPAPPPLAPETGPSGTGHTPPDESPYSAPGSRRDGFFGWVRGLGISRGQDRWIGGVASGIAQRTGLDPVLVRGICIVLALFGVGLLLYGLAWGLLPEPDGRIHTEEALSGNWTGGMTGALAVTILGLNGPRASFWARDGWLNGTFWPLFWIAVVAGSLYWLSRRGRVRGGAVYLGPLPKPGPGAREDDPGTGASIRDGFVPPPRTAVPTSAGEPKTPKVSPAPPGAYVAIILGTAVLAAAALYALDYAQVLRFDQPLAVALAAAAVILGLGIALLGALGRSPGGLGFSAVIAVVGSLLSGGALVHGNILVANDTRWVAAANTDLSEGYTVAAANGTLDLRAAGDGVIPVSTVAGNMVVVVPDDVPVVVHSRNLFGSTQIRNGDAWQESGGIWQEDSEKSLNPGADGTPIELHIDGIFSRVLVTTDINDASDSNAQEGGNNS